MAIGCQSLKSVSRRDRVLGVVDYGAGNLRSLGNALNYVGLEWAMVDKPKQIFDFDKILLPGVGAFGAAMNKLEQTGLRAAIIDASTQGRFVMGICLGMQLLTNASEEDPGEQGLGLIDASTRKLPESPTRTNTGFRDVATSAERWRLDYSVSTRDYYFNHGFFVEPRFHGVSAGSTRHGKKVICAAISYENLSGVQFHPEKSQGQGLAVIRNFARNGTLRL